MWHQSSGACSTACVRALLCLHTCGQAGAHWRALDGVEGRCLSAWSHCGRCSAQGTEHISETTSLESDSLEFGFLLPIYASS